MKYKIVWIMILVNYLAAGQASFSFNINGTPPAGLKQALEIAGAKWSNYLQITIPVKVNVFLLNSVQIPFSGLTLANGRKNFANAPFQDILYVSSLANQLAQNELNPGQYDMDIYFNLATSFYYGNGKPSQSQQDFITTAMHELGHGLGFYSDGYVDASGTGSFGNIPPSAIFPLSTSFPWRGQDSVPTIFDKYLIKTSGNPLINSATNNSSALGDSIKNGAIYFNGVNFANTTHSNTPIRVSGGNGSYSLGVDLLHIHDSYVNTIMSYAWGAGDTVRIPNAWELGILKEIGWKPLVTSLAENHPDEVSFTNPVDRRLEVKAARIRRLTLYSVNGEYIQTASRDEGFAIDTALLPDGLYFFVLEFDEEKIARKVIVMH